MDEIEIERFNRGELSLLHKNAHNQTPLTESIISGKIDAIANLLKIGAAKSVFVAGYLPGTLVCTLPQASQPPSSVFTQPSPFTDTSLQLLDLIDESICARIEEMKREKIQFLAAASATALPLNSTNQTSLSRITPFNFFPPFLKVLNVTLFPLFF